MWKALTQLRVKDLECLICFQYSQFSCLLKILKRNFTCTVKICQSKKFIQPTWKHKVLDTLQHQEPRNEILNICYPQNSSSLRSLCFSSQVLLSPEQKYPQKFYLCSFYFKLNLLNLNLFNLCNSPNFWVCFLLLYLLFFFNHSETQQREKWVTGTFCFFAHLCLCDYIILTWQESVWKRNDKKLLG